jgi:peptide/nickel transport system substrate-binding protein
VIEEECVKARLSRAARAGAAVLSAAALAVLAACGGPAGPGGAGGDAGEPQRGGTLVFSWNSDAQSLDATRCGQSLNWGPCQAVYGTLLNYDAAAQRFSPGMAESFTSEDGKTWTLKLRGGVTFSDGTPFDAAAVVFNWDRAKDPASLSPGASYAKQMSYRATDARTVVLELPQVNWQLEWALYSELAFIGSPTAIQRKGPDFGTSPVGAGPFTFESWQRGTRLAMVRNPGYWDQPRPYVDRIEFATIGSDDQRLNALRSGQITVMSTITDEYAERALNEGFVEKTLPHVGGTGVRVSWRKGPLADPDVRLAVAKLIDAQQITNAFYDGVPGPTTFAPQSSPYFDPKAAYPAQDVAGAQALIDGYRARTGVPEVVVTYNMVAGIPLQDQVAQMLQAQLQRVNGLRLEILAKDGAGFVTDTTTGNYELALVAINGVNPDLLWQLFRTGASQNTAGYSDPATDEALDGARLTKDRNQQIALYKTATERIAGQVGHRSWRYQTTHLVSAGTVHGVDPSYNYFLRADTVWLDQS